jgi:sensor histidine kinase YesM
MTDLDNKTNTGLLKLDGRSVLLFLRDLVYFAIAALVQTYLTCSRCGTGFFFFIVALFTFLTWVILWKGNSLITRYISCKISWMEFPTKRLIVGVITTIGFTVLAMAVLMESFQYLFEINFGDSYMTTMYLTIVITIIVSLVLHAREFFLSLRKATVNADRLEKENITAKYESLKNQVNPHFLFNSFNALSNLVYEDPDKAVKFIKQLSEVYRYVLDTREKEVMPLNEEMKFLQSYIYLQQIRFGDKLKFDISLNGANGFVAPLALQMLIENAIKHNVVSDDDPLTISLNTEGNFVIVKNNLQLKGVLGEPSAGVGLENIIKRYEFLSNVPVAIIKSGESFTVKLPLLTDKL